MNDSNKTSTSKNNSPAVGPARDQRLVPMVGGRIDSTDLLFGEPEILIDHGRDTYRLRLTSQNKLILTK